MELAYLTRSDNRTAALLLLEREGGLAQSEIEQRLSASRRTVSRILAELTEGGYVREADSGYHLTRFGAIVIDAYRQCKEQTDLARRYQPFLANVDDADVDFDPEFLRGADITVSTDAEPYAALDRMLALRRDASQVRAAASLITKKSIEQITDRLRSDETVEFEFVFPVSLYERLQSQPAYSEPFRKMTAAPSVTTWIRQEEIPLLHAVTDGVTAVGTSVAGSPHALVESTNPELREWVTARLDQFRQQAVPIEECSP
jgi:predicted transcriptional regulator